MNHTAILNMTTALGYKGLKEALPIKNTLNGHLGEY